MDFTFDDFVGNEQTIKLVKMLIHAAEGDSTARIPDMSFLGPAGHGKTTLARLVAAHLDRKCIEINATIVTDPFQFKGYFTGNEMPKGGGIIFIDECHALKKKIQTNLLSATENPRKLHTSHKGEIYRDSLPENLSFIFATTKRSYIIPELAQRLETVEFSEYSEGEKCEIAANYLKKRKKIPVDQLDAACIVDIASRARNARKVIRFCDRIVDHMKMKGSPLAPEIINETFEILGIDKNGLSKLDRKLLRYLAKRGKPVGLETLSDLMEMPKADIKSEIEPFLLRKNFMVRSSAGRIITQPGRAAIKAGGR